MHADHLDEDWAYWLCSQGSVGTGAAAAAGTTCTATPPLPLLLLARCESPGSCPAGPRHQWRRDRAAGQAAFYLPQCADCGFRKTSPNSAARAATSLDPRTLRQGGCLPRCLGPRPAATSPVGLPRGLEASAPASGPSAGRAGELGSAGLLLGAPVRGLQRCSSLRPRRLGARGRCPTEGRPAGSSSGTGRRCRPLVTRAQDSARWPCHTAWPARPQRRGRRPPSLGQQEGQAIGVPFEKWPQAVSHHLNSEEREA